MRKAFTSWKEWYRPRKRHSFFDRWWRNLVMLLPTWPLMHIFVSGPWFEGIGSTLVFSFIYGLAEYGYFHVYGGTDEDYPNPPKDFRPFL